MGTQKNYNNFITYYNKCLEVVRKRINVYLEHVFQIMLSIKVYMRE